MDKVLWVSEFIGVVLLTGPIVVIALIEQILAFIFGGSSVLHVNDADLTKFKAILLYLDASIAVFYLECVNDITNGRVEKLRPGTIAYISNAKHKLKSVITK